MAKDVLHRGFPWTLSLGEFRTSAKGRSLDWRTHEVGHKCYGVGLFIFVIDFMLYYRLPNESSLILLYFIHLITLDIILL